MAGITCAGCDQDAVVGLMSYGPDGGTTDLCAEHLAHWALAYAGEAFPQVAAAMAQAPETAATGPEEGEPPLDRARAKRRAQRSAAAQQEAESVKPASAQVEGAEHHQ